MVQAGFIFGGRRGAGILLVRNENNEWSKPAFITLTGGSFGLQIGAQSTDVVLAFMDKSVVMRSLAQSFRLGGNVSVAAGPVGGEVVSPPTPVLKSFPILAVQVFLPALPLKAPILVLTAAPIPASMAGAT